MQRVMGIIRGLLLRSRFLVEGVVGFGLPGSGFLVLGSGFLVPGSGFRLWACQLRVTGLKAAGGLVG